MPTIRRRGFDAAPISDRIEAITHDDWRAGNPRAALARAVRIFTERADHDAPDLARAIDQERPDALLVDVNAWGALAAAEAWAGPWAMFCPYPLAVRSRDVPPFGPGLPPARGPLGRLRDQLLRPIVFGTLERTMAPPINRIRDRLGLAPVGGADDIFGRAPLLLYLTAEPFEYPRSDWPDNVVLVGPCAWDPPTDPPAWLDDIDRPIVLVTTSSEFQDDTRLVRVALEALAEEPVAVLATLPASDPARVRTPANARVERFIPTARCWTAPAAPSPTAAWAPPRRRWPTACPSAPSPSAATNWRSRGGWRSPAREPGCPPSAWVPTAYAPRWAKRCGYATAPSGSRRRSRPRAGRPPPPTRSSTACCTGSCRRSSHPDRNRPPSAAS